MDTAFYHNQYSKTDLSKVVRKTLPYTELLSACISTKDYTKPESALAIAGDTKYQNHIAKKLQKFTEVKHVVLVGIGGSSLGTEAVYGALKTPQSPTLTVLDALEDSTLATYAALLKRVKNPKHIALVIVSKSGTTTETVCNADIALSLFEKTYTEAHKEQVIVIGDEDSLLVAGAKKRKILTFVIPKNIGGRYSVFTAVGVVPLTLLGIKVAELRKGAMEAVTRDGLSDAAYTASVIALHAQNGMHTLNFFTFNKELITLGYWYRQLLAESIGKPTTKKKKYFTAQIHPTVSSSIDLHSMAQLYLGGYKGVYTHFVEAKAQDTFDSTTHNWVSECVPSLSGKKLSDVKEAISLGVERAYSEADLPYHITRLTNIDAFSVGKFLAQSMSMIMYLCALSGVDAFSQPQVELYKKHTRDMLNS